MTEVPLCWAAGDATQDVWVSVLQTRADSGQYIANAHRFGSAYCKHAPIRERATLCVTSAARVHTVEYRGTSLIRNTPPVGPYSSTMPRDIWRS